MATVNFRLRSKSNKNASISIYLSSGRGKVIELNTKFSINENDWSKTTKRPIPSNTKKRPTGNSELEKAFDEHQKFKQDLHEDLDKLYTYIFKEQNKDLGKGVVIDSFWLESKINDCFERVSNTDESLVLNYIQNTQ